MTAADTLPWYCRHSVADGRSCIEFYARTTEENQTLTERGELKQGSSSRNSEKIATPESHYTYTAVEIYA